MTDTPDPYISTFTMQENTIQRLKDQLDTKDAEIARLKDALRSAYMQDAIEGSGWITWRYTSGFDRADEATQQKMAREEAEELMKREGYL